VTITNLGTWGLRITAAVTDTAQDLYVEGVRLEGVNWGAFGMSIAKGDSDLCTATLTVPDTYTDIGTQKGTIIFWAQEAP
jgi:hypothetical protein